MEDENQTVSSDLIRGHINTIILRALYDGDKYGYEIISEIEHKSHGKTTLFIQCAETSGKRRFHYFVLGRFGQRRKTEILFSHRFRQKNLGTESV